MNYLLNTIKEVLYKNLYIITLIIVLYYFHYKKVDKKLLIIISIYFITSVILELFGQREQLLKEKFQEEKKAEDCGENCELKGDTCICEDRPKKEPTIGVSDVEKRQDLTKEIKKDESTINEKDAEKPVGFLKQAMDQGLVVPKKEAIPVSQKPQPIPPSITEKPSEDLLNQIQDKIFNINFYVSPGSTIPPTTPQHQITPEKPQSDTLDMHKRCIALQKAGFNPGWSKKDVENLFNNPAEKGKILKINNEYMKITGEGLLSDNLIEECFPGYLSRGLQLVDSDPQNLSKSTPENLNIPLEAQNINQNINQTNNATETITTPQSSYEDYIPDSNAKNLSNINDPLKEANPLLYVLETDDNQQVDNEQVNNQQVNKDQVDNEQVNQTVNLSSNRFFDRKKICSKDELSKEIGMQMEIHYHNIINKMIEKNEIPPNYSPEKVYKGYKDNFPIILDKSMKQINYFIENFKYKKYSEWRQELEKLKVMSFSGMPVDGTDFFIPWSIIEKYEVCFSMPENDSHSYPVDFSSTT